MSKSILIAVIAILGIIMLAAAFIFLTQPTVITNGNNMPNITPGVISPSPTPATNGQAHSDCDALRIITPQENDEAASPLEIEIIIDNRNASCNWTVFEAQAGIARIEAENGTELGAAPLMTIEDWMNEGPTTFTAEVEFGSPEIQNIKLIIEEENPSGTPEEQSIIEIPLRYLGN